MNECWGLLNRGVILIMRRKMKSPSRQLKSSKGHILGNECGHRFMFARRCQNTHTIVTTHVFSTYEQPHAFRLHSRT